MQNQGQQLNNSQAISVDCLKITEDKSSKSRVQTPDARLIIATSAAPRREGWNPRFKITAMTKTRSIKAASQHYCSTKTRESKIASLLQCNGQDAELETRISAIHAIPRRRAQGPCLTWSLMQNLKLVCLKRHLNGKTRSSNPAS